MSDTPPIRYGSICSGIEAASVAWAPLGWRPSFFSEIDAFPRAVLSHHHPEVPLHGDFTTIQAGQYEPIDLLVGGTPCQSFSVAGRRLGLDDPRGNLAIEFCRLARRLRPRWVVWENVPGVLSSNGGRDFGAFLGLLGECGYGWAYRVLDAQYVRVDGYPRAVPQRRNRVFVVGYLGDWRRAAAVLFEPEGMRGDHAPRREAGEGIAAGTLGRSSASSSNVQSFGLSPDVFDRSGEAATGTAADRSGLGVDHEVAYALRAKRPGGVATFGGNRTSGAINVSPALNAHGGAARRMDFESEAFVCAPDVAATITRGAESAGKVGYAGRRQEDDVNLVAYEAKDGQCLGSAPALDCGAEDGPRRNQGGAVILQGPSAVRRLTPRECERLQGFPDDYTAVSYRGKPAADGPRYKALGNSMAVNAMRWIGRRIEIADALIGGAE